MVKIERLAVIGRDFNIRPYEEKLWFYRALDIHSMIYAELITPRPISKSGDIFAREQLKKAIQRKRKERTCSRENTDS